MKTEVTMKTEKFEEGVSSYKPIAPRMKIIIDRMMARRVARSQTSSSCSCYKPIAPRMKVIIDRMMARRVAQSQTSSSCSWPKTKAFIVREFLNFLNTATEEELKGVKDIEEETANSVIKLREESSLEELKDLEKIQIAEEQIHGMMMKFAEKNLK